MKPNFSLKDFLTRPVSGNNCEKYMNSFRACMVHLKNDHGELETLELISGEVRNLASRRPTYNLLAQHPTLLFSHGCGNIARGESTNSCGFPFMTS
jgi:hypothetical protein